MKLVKSESSGSDFGLIGRGIEITGDIVFSDQLNVEGKVNGRITSGTGTLVVGETGHVEATVDIAVCVIHGTLHGDLTAKSKVEIRRTGKVHGDVVTPNLLVEEGALFNGVIRMGQEAGSRLLGEVLPGDADSAAQRRTRGA
ncbi:MAG TPA: polymer-forming cytoskeletal protein [Blastocatellia bacterium]|nr:polymer-forming cytoskeletal protein [Blastocatellia bacterium]